MVSSDDFFAFIKEQTKLEVIRDAEGTPEFTNNPLTGADLAAALGHLKDLCEVEAAKATADKHHDAHMRMHDKQTMAGLAGDGGHGNYN